MEHVYLNYKVEEVSTVREVLLKQFKVSSRLLRKLKRNSRIFCNQKEAWVNDVLDVGDIVSIDITFEENNDKIKAQKNALDVLYEDNSILIVNKPANVVVHPTCIHQEGTLANLITLMPDGLLTTKRLSSS